MSTPVLLLPEIRFRRVRPVPPIVLFDELSRSMPSPPFRTAAAPLTSVPIMFPYSSVLLAELFSRTPLVRVAGDEVPQVVLLRLVAAEHLPGAVHLDADLVRRGGRARPVDADGVLLRLVLVALNLDAVRPPVDDVEVADDALCRDEDEAVGAGPGARAVEDDQRVRRAAGRAELGVIVAGPEPILRVILSTPVCRFAFVIACRSEPAPESFVLVTV
jgi:hypothetical protein